MPINRYFTDYPLAIGQDVTLRGTELHHLVRVTRKRPQEPIELVNGQGHLARGSVASVTKARAIVTIGNVVTEAAPAFELILAQAICRPNRLALILEKGTELGVTAFWLFSAERSERDIVSLERASTICIAALKQSGRLHLPNLVLKPPVAEWSSLLSPAFYGSLRPDVLPLTSQAVRDRATMVIGPESGFTRTEISKLEELGAFGVRLNRHTLRTDTAAIVSIGMITQMGACR